MPIVLGYINYRDKTGGVGGMIYPTGNFDDDFSKILEFYKQTLIPSTLKTSTLQIN